MYSDKGRVSGQGKEGWGRRNTHKGVNTDKIEKTRRQTQHKLTDNRTILLLVIGDERPPSPLSINGVAVETTGVEWSTNMEGVYKKVLYGLYFHRRLRSFSGHKQPFCQCSLLSERKNTEKAGSPVGPPGRGDGVKV